MNRASQWFAFGFLVFAFVSLLGHVCVLPHVTVVEAAVPESHDHESGHHAADDAHLASCEATRPGVTATSVPIPSAIDGIVVGGVVQVAKQAPTPHIVPSGSPPPLYLQNSVLLI